MDTQKKSPKSQSETLKQRASHQPQSNETGSPETDMEWVMRTMDAGQHTPSPSTMLQLQRLIGNRAAGQFVSQSEPRSGLQRSTVNPNGAVIKPIGGLLANMLQRWPAPETDDTPPKSNFPMYKCHDAVVYWVLRSLPLTAKQAQKALSLLQNKKGPSAGWIVEALGYGSGTRINGAQDAAAGDILFTGATSYVAHTMVVTDADHIKGFNNYGTFGTEAGGDQYSVEQFSNSEGRRMWHTVKGQEQMGRGPDASFPTYKVAFGTAQAALRNFIATVKSSDKNYNNPNMNVKKKGCYITTAVTMTRGLPDDCDELTALRAFRDDYLLKLPNGEELVALYYDYAPLILEEISKQKDAGAVYSTLYDVIHSCVDAIKNGDNEFAYQTYCRMVIKLQEEYLPDLTMPAYQI